MANKTEKIRPPRITRHILYFLLDPFIREQAMGDLEEHFLFNRKNRGKFRACWTYRLQLLPVLLSFLRNSLFGGLSLFRSYLKSAVRHLKKAPLYSLITVGGLILGMTCFITAMLYTKYERSFDRFHPNNGRIFRVYSQLNADSEDSQALRVTTPFPLAETLIQEYPEVVHAVSIGEFSSRDNFLRWENRTFKARGISATPGFFDIFSFPLIQGSQKEALSSPDSIILSRSLKERVFGNADPLGKQIMIDDGDALQVTGILEDVPRNSNLHFDYIVSLHKKDDAKSRYYLGWDYNFVMTYVALNSSAGGASLEEKISDLGKRYLPESKKNTMFRLQPLAAIHLHPFSAVDPVDTGDARQVSLVLLIGFLILAIACINAVNLFMARASLRVKEIGLRKMHGAGRIQLTLQLLIESFFSTLFALVISVLLAIWAVPRFGVFLGSGISLGILGWPFLILLLLGTAAAVALGSGLYPAFVLSSPRLSDLIGGRQKNGTQRSGLRSLLVIGQFTAVVVFLLLSFTVSRQLSFIQNQPLGFEKEHIVVLKSSDALVMDKWDALTHSLLESSRIHAASLSMPPSRIEATTITNLPENEKDTFQIHKAYVDYSFLEFFDIGLSEGRFFSREFTSDETQRKIVLNEAAARRFGQTDMIGKRIFLTTPWGDKTDHEVIGIVKDFHFQPLHKPISPLALELVPERRSNILCVKIDASDVYKTLASIRKTYAQFCDPNRLELSFMDESIAAMYTGEQKLKAIVRFFSVLSVLIACFGLFGLATHATERKTKEIGIRKVLGASVQGIIRMLNKEFLRWVLMANIVAWPVGYYMMHEWLMGFAYRVSFPVWLFPVVGAISVGIAMVTVSSQTFLAARKNPVDSIRYE
jgi:putative ABC transport system permease protein